MLTTHGNYNRWKGGSGQTGETKEKLLTEVKTLLKENQIFHRENRDIRTKINDIEKSYRSARDWLSKTGQGILDSQAEDGENQVKAYVFKLCKYYDQLDEIMRDRPSSPMKALH